MYVLATLEDLRQHIGLESDDTRENPRLIEALQAATAIIERRTWRKFQPYRATLRHDSSAHNPQPLLLRDDLLQLHQVQQADGKVIAPEGTRASGGMLHFTPGYQPIGTVSLMITGIWGYHPQWAQAWQVIDQLAPTGIDANETQLAIDTTQTKVAAGHILRLDDEYVRVSAVDTTNQQLHIQRGVNGTQASAHLAGIPIEQYQMPADVYQACLRWALWLYREPDQAEVRVPLVLIQTLDGLRRITVA